MLSWRSAFTMGVCSRVSVFCSSGTLVWPRVVCLCRMRSSGIGFGVHFVVLGAVGDPDAASRATHSQVCAQVPCVQDLHFCNEMTGAQTHTLVKIG